MGDRERQAPGDREAAVVDIWTFAVEPAVYAGDVVGFTVEATDGRIGKVDEGTADEAGRGHLVVDTGPWIFGKKVVLPAGVVNHVDLDAQIVYVDRSRDEIKHAPELLPESAVNEDYRDRLGGYYR